MAEMEYKEYSQEWWANKLTTREAELDEKWRRAADKIVKRYLDIRDDSTLITTEEYPSRKYNIFWANTQITKAALYATPPKPQVTRQFGDAKDDVARTAALILQRMLNFDLQADDSRTHDSLNMANEDHLIPGLGQVWLRLETDTEPIPPVIDPTTQQEMAPAGERIVDQRVECDYVQWRDFIWEASRIWREVGWVARRCWMRKKEFAKRFGKEKLAQLEASIKEKKDNGELPKGFTEGKIEVFEIWCKDMNKAYWISKFADQILDTQDDPLLLDEFFPCPMEPISATHTTNSTIPRSDYTMVSDQYEELDILNTRIAMLTKALRVVGVYDKNNGELTRMLSGSEFAMIPVDNWAAFAENGGLKGQVDWFPIEIIAQVLERLMNQRVAVINQIYELTSISDIMRGASNPRDTLGAQKLKAQYSSVRLQLKQQAVGKFVRQALRIKAEIIARHFDPRIIAEQSQIMMTESAQFAQPAIELIKNYKASEYRINIGEETLSLADYNAERELRTEYLTAVGQFLSQAGMMAQAQPAAMPYLLRIIAWVTASFRGASDIESVLDEAIELAKNAPPQGEEGPPPKPTPEEEAKAQIAVDNNKSKNVMRESVVQELAKNVLAPTPEPPNADV